MSIAEAQSDMREAYGRGAAGAITSATIWLIAALVAFFAEPTTGVLTLLLGGTLIFPLSILLCKAMGQSGKHRADNPLAPLAIQGTAWMIFCMPIAAGTALHTLEWFFPSMLLIIGGRYLTFSTLYGMKIFLAMGATLALSAYPLIALEAPAFVGALAGASIEYVFGFAILASGRDMSGTELR